MELCYDGALVLPSSYAVMDNDEMTYVEGGISAAAKAGIIAAIVVGGVALTVALAYGQLWLAAKIMGYAVKTYVRKLGVKAVATVVAGSLGFSFSAVTAAVTATLKL